MTGIACFETFYVGFFGYPKFRTFGCPEIRMCKNLEFRTSGNPYVQIAGNLNVLKSDFRKSGKRGTQQDATLNDSEEEMNQFQGSHRFSTVLADHHVFSMGPNAFDAWHRMPREILHSGPYYGP